MDTKGLFARNISGKPLRGFDSAVRFPPIAIADGGERTAEAIHDALIDRWITLAVHDPIGRIVEGRYALVESAGGERLAVLEMSTASLQFAAGR